MSKILKILLGLVAALVVLIAIAAIALSSLDANRYRSQIAAKVKEVTGRDLTIGNIHLSLFPGIGVSLKNVQLGNANGFGPQPQATFGEAAVGVRLLPLIFDRRVEVGRVELDDASIDLEVAADGRNNWSDLHGVQASRDAQVGAPSSASAPSVSVHGHIEGVLFSGILIHNATLHYNNRTSGKSYALEGLNVKTGTIDTTGPFDVSTDFRIQLSDPAVAAVVNASGKMKLAPQPLHYSIAGLTLHVDGSGDSLPGGKLALDLKSDVDGSADAVALNNLAVKLDDSKIGGKLALTSLQQMAATFTVQIDQFDLDRYRAAGKKTDGTATPAAAASSKTAAAAADTRIPVESLDAAGLDGTIDLGRLQTQGITTSNVHLVIHAPRGEQKHFQLTANLYGGTLGSDTLITPGKQPRYGQNLQLKAIDVGALVRDYTHKDKLEGKGDIDLRFTSAGDTVGAIKRALNGDLSFALKNAVVKGFNLAQMVRQGQALLGGQTVQDNGPQQTDFSAITGGGPIVNGVLHAERLDGQSPMLRLTGGGTIDLVHQTIDYLAQPTIVNTASGQGGRSTADLNGITVPVHVTGTFAEPHYAIDVQSALRQKAVQKLTDRLGQKSSGLGGLLQNLGGLFGSKQQQPAQPNNGNAPTH